jgi:hypothetical protein
MKEALMRYMLLIYDDPGELARLSAAERQGIYPEYREFTESIVKSGNFRAGDPLQPVSTATTVRLRQGKQMVTDGPFAETKEHLGGYYMIEASDIDEAIGIAARIPSARCGAIEVRPIMEHDR